MCKWHLENKHTGSGRTVCGSFDEVIAEAMTQCIEGWQRFVVWQQPANIRVADVGRSGPTWIKHQLTGDEVTRLMRRHHRTIAALAFQIGIAEKRVRQVRCQGLDDRNAVRDWLEAITGADPGPLPERYRIGHRLEEGDCGECGCPLFVGEYAYEYALGMFCSFTCCRAGYRRKMERIPC